ncbi:MAG: hypothetical protein RXR20_15905 [Paraburkholderia sp.]|uniref:hypothetical protein n=1 Tax=Paraburkholderia sp. TaxID=1926495 RepID=UPI00397D60C9
MGLGIAHPIVALDFVVRGLAVKPIDADVVFIGVLVLRPGTPLAENARQFLSHMRMQLGRDQKALEASMADASVRASRHTP